MADLPLPAAFVLRWDANVWVLGLGVFPWEGWRMPKTTAPPRSTVSSCSQMAFWYEEAGGEDFRTWKVSGFECWRTSIATVAISRFPTVFRTGNHSGSDPLTLCHTSRGRGMLCFRDFCLLVSS